MPSSQVHQVRVRFSYGLRVRVRSEELESGSGEEGSSTPLHAPLQVLYSVPSNRQPCLPVYGCSCQMPIPNSSPSQDIPAESTHASGHVLMCLVGELPSRSRKQPQHRGHVHARAQRRSSGRGEQQLWSLPMSHAHRVLLCDTNRRGCIVICVVMQVTPSNVVLDLLSPLEKIMNPIIKPGEAHPHVSLLLLRCQSPTCSLKFMQPEARLPLPCVPLPRLPAGIGRRKTGSKFAPCLCLALCVCTVPYWARSRAPLLAREAHTILSVMWPVVLCGSMVV